MSTLALFALAGIVWLAAGRRLRRLPRRRNAWTILRRLREAGY